MSEAGVVVERGPDAIDTDSAAAYRPHLDGLRAVAVYLVVLFHAGIARFSGGFIGVDVFFVLSGYLVTQLLLRDVAHGGSIRFGRFYARRFRRLLPAAFVALLVTAAVYTALATPAEVASVVGSFKAAFLYSTNWYFIHQAAGYFGADVSANPVLHFWSLAVEEQFYLLWPLALGGMYAVTRRVAAPRRMHVIRLVVGAGALASVGFALSIRSINPNRAYYGTDARAYELLAGALIALTPALIAAAARDPRAARAATLVSIAALGGVATSVLDDDAIVRGFIATVITCILIVALEAGGGVVQRALSTRPLVYLGKVSYGTYLWHWLVILVVIRVFDPAPLAIVGIAILVATALASLSFEMLERPIRLSPRLDGHRGAVIAAGLAISVASALIVIPHVVDPDHAGTAVARSRVGANLTPVGKNLDWIDHPLHFTKCLDKPVSACTVVDSFGPTILLMGDSHAWMLIPTFKDIALRRDMKLVVSGEGGCPWPRNVYTPAFAPSCKKLQDDEYDRLIPTVKPDIIVLVDAEYAHPGSAPTPLEGPDKAPLTDAQIANATGASIRQLRAPGRKILLVEPIPVPRAPGPFFNPYVCLQTAKVQEACRYVPWLAPTKLEIQYRILAAGNADIDDLDLDRLVCPLLPRCDPVLNGHIVKKDQSHLRANFATALGPDVETYMESVGLIPPGAD